MFALLMEHRKVAGLAAIVCRDQAMAAGMRPADFIAALVPDQPDRRENAFIELGHALVEVIARHYPDSPAGREILAGLPDIRRQRIHDN